MTSAKELTLSKSSFLQFVISKNNRFYLVSALIITIVYFILLKIYFPFPSFYSDSNAYVQCANNNQLISFRPTEYSRFISFFHFFSKNDIALIIGQYISNIFANLLLFFSLIYFFPLHKILKIILLILLIANPLYILYSNYVLSDSLFCSFTVIWFVTLLWMIYKPNWLVFALQLTTLVVLFGLRYNAITYPLITSVAVFFSHQQLWKKITIVATSVVVIYIVQLSIAIKTKNLTGTYVFSAFGGWQLASNALYVVRSENIDSTIFKDNDSKAIFSLSKKYFDSIEINKYGKVELPINGAFLWDKTSPLKQYLSQYQINKNSLNYFRSWTAMGPVYSHFGITVIKNKPVAYIKHFVLPNTASYWYPVMEAYDNYNSGVDTVSYVVEKYFNYTSNKVTAKSADSIYKLFMRPYKFAFPVINIVFILLAFLVLVNKSIRRQYSFFYKATILASVLYIINFCFIIVLAPTVFRYHVAVVTLITAFSICFVQYIFIQKNTINS